MGCRLEHLGEQCGAGAVCAGHEQCRVARGDRLGGTAELQQAQRGVRLAREGERLGVWPHEQPRPWWRDLARGASCSHDCGLVCREGARDVTRLEELGAALLVLPNRREELLKDGILRGLGDDYSRRAGMPAASCCSSSFGQIIVCSKERS